MDKPEQKKKEKRIRATPCETCLFYDVIDEEGTLGCTVDVDEDEAWRERADMHSECHYYQFYDEYKTVQKQN
ncbi:MAG: hypothetical protein IKQ87_04510 [Clostridia bacterium]|nr:hypothetical protein [Clostridia bacterium]